MEAFNFWVGIVFQDYLSQPSLSMNDKSCRKYQKELLLAHCNLLRRTLSEKGVAQCVDVLQKYVNLILQSKYTHFMLDNEEHKKRKSVSISGSLCDFSNLCFQFRSRYAVSEEHGHQHYR